MHLEMHADASLRVAGFEISKSRGVVHLNGASIAAIGTTRRALGDISSVVAEQLSIKVEISRGFGRARITAADMNRPDF